MRSPSSKLGFRGGRPGRLPCLCLGTLTLWVCTFVLSKLNLDREAKVREPIVALTWNYDDYVNRHKKKEDAEGKDAVLSFEADQQ